ncbi:transcriptional regulator, TraR/DksA family [Thiohalomonas denitrificans]|uniref:RNA polymerase-binding transcription factor DksA n=1 Tax=Thiohalomonas denitrificans TaxID=415747 RepID=A0A1G5PIK2_9GAMM|nr:transcriptional regulator, TraR/DksA family [Thiohalomonas denitrificans]
MPAKKTAAEVATETTENASVSSNTSAKKPAVKSAASVENTAPQKSAAEGFGKFTPYEPKKGEEYMSEKMREHFRHILTGWRKELMEEVDRTVHHMKDEAANFPDPNDRATQESEFTMELRTRDRERKLIKKITESLDNLDEGEYGYCESCGIEIGIRRLEARPTATLCIDCKTLDEIREKQRG